MPKVSLKMDLGDQHGFSCYICGKTITAKEIEDGLIDTDRLIPKAEGQSYQLDMTRLACPDCHMRRHGTLRIRPEYLGQVKIAIDDREQWMKIRNKIANQIKAIERGVDTCSEITLAHLEEMLDTAEMRYKDRSKLLSSLILGNKEDGLIKSALNVVGLGPDTVAYLVTYLIPEKAKHRSSYWKYTGLDAASHERYTKGETSGGNKKLRTALWRCVDSMWKNRNCPYRAVGDRVKERLVQSEKQTQTRNTQGKLITAAWKDTKPGHRHGAAYRAMMKELLGDYWVISRLFAGLPVDNPYVVDMLGHEPHDGSRERGWLYPEDAIDTQDSI